MSRQCRKQTEADTKAFAKLCGQSFACADDAKQALAAFQNTLTLTTVVEPQIVSVPHYQGRGRPAKACSPDTLTYRIDGTLASLPAAYRARLRQHSGFILATNQLDTEALSDAELLQAYKAQQRVERGFRFLKDPLFLASSLYLKSPQRIMALMLVMTLCLLVYAALEHRIRDRLKAQEHTFLIKPVNPLPTPRRAGYSSISSVFIYLSWPTVRCWPSTLMSTTSACSSYSVRPMKRFIPKIKQGVCGMSVLQAWMTSLRRRGWCSWQQ